MTETAPRSGTELELLAIDHPRERGRRVAVRVEGPAGYRRESQPLPHVIVLHGFKGFMHWGFFPLLSRRIASSGLVAISLNVSGSGVGEDLENFTKEEAFERNTIRRELEDLNSVRYLVRSQELEGVDPGRGAIFGHSRGGGVSVLHAAEHGDYRALVTWAALDNFTNFDRATRREWRERGWIPIQNARTGQTLRLGTAALDEIEREAESIDPLLAATSLRLPTLLVHGTRDDAVPHASSSRLKQAIPGARLLSIDGAGHTFGARHPLQETPEELEQALSETVAFFKKHLLSPRP